MSLVLNRTNVTKMPKPRSEIERVRVGVDQRFWLGRGSRSYHGPIPAGDLGFQKTMAENRENRDRIEDEDKQHHGVGHGPINPVIWDGYHDLEANPVQHRRYPVELRVPWSPKPIGSTRRWRAYRVCLFDVIKILHLQSLSIWKSSTGSSDWKQIHPDHRGPIAHGHRTTPAPSIPPPLHRALFVGSVRWACFKSWTRPQ